MIQRFIAWLVAVWRNNICDTFENVHPYAHQQCAGCNRGNCNGCPFIDKNYNPFAKEEEDEELNLNWMGTDDVPKMKEGNFVFKDGDWKPLVRKCACGQAAHNQLGPYCSECFFNISIEDPKGDYIIDPATGDVLLMPNHEKLIL